VSGEMAEAVGQSEVTPMSGTCPVMSANVRFVQQLYSRVDVRTHRRWSLGMVVPDDNNWPRLLAFEQHLLQRLSERDVPPVSRAVPSCPISSPEKTDPEHEKPTNHTPPATHLQANIINTGDVPPAKPTPGKPQFDFGTETIPPPLPAAALPDDLRSLAARAAEGSSQHAPPTPPLKQKTEDCQASTDNGPGVT